MTRNACVPAVSSWIRGTITISHRRPDDQPRPERGNHPEVHRVMVKCPFCGFDNEDGALFCEQCKSDLSAVPAAPAAEVPVAQVVEAVPVADVPIAEAVPVAEAVASAPPMAQMVEPIGEVTMPAVAPLSAEPAAAPEGAPAAPAGQSVPPGAQPKLVVRRGL